MATRSDDIELFFHTMKQSCDSDHIKAVATVPAVPLELNCQNGYELGAPQRVLRHLEAVYVPSDFEIKFIRDRIESAYEFGKNTYQNEQRFLEMLYDTSSSESRWPNCTDNEYPTLLTGRAGVGKSSLIRAISRVLNAGTTVRVQAAHSQLKTMPVANATSMAQEFSINEVLKQLAMLNSDEKKYDRKKLRALVKSRLIQRLTCLYSYDEVQVITSKTLTSVWNILSDLQSLRFPWVFAANYGLVTRLLKGPEEKVQRVASKVVVLTPPLAGSVAWVDLLKEYDKVFGDALEENLESMQSELWDYSCGIRRVLINILFHAYKISRERSASKVSVKDIYIASRAHGVMCQANSVRKQLGNSFPNNDTDCPIASPDEDQLNAEVKAAADRIAGSNYAGLQAPVDQKPSNVPTDSPLPIPSNAKPRKATVPSQKERENMSSEEYLKNFLHPGKKPKPSH